jgi:D-sedoheptulose 7-phosphate isomerase
MASKALIFKEAFQRHTEAVKKSTRLLPHIEKAGKILVGALRREKKVLVCGNGGSAADSQHFAAELTGRYKTERRALPAISLTTDTSALTAIANDYGYERVFSRQVEAVGVQGDILVAFSTSGSSKNILEAIRVAREKKMKVIALTGEKGRKLRNRVDVLIAVPAGETARIQEMHELVYHSWCEYIDAHFPTTE